MPDSQNKQGEPDIDRISEKFSDGFSKSAYTPEMRVKLALLEYKSLLSQRHAPSKEVEERLHEIAKKWYDKLEYGSGVDVWGMLISALTELATELTKEREYLKPYEEELDHCDKLIEQLRAEGDIYGVNFHEGRKSGIIKGDIIQSREKAALRQQLAEANEKLSQAECDLLPHYAAIKAGDKLVEELRTQNIALSAVVEKCKCTIKLFMDNGRMEPTMIAGQEALALQPDRSLYGRLCGVLSKCVVQLHHIRGGYILGTKLDEAHDEATQLLAGLGHK